MQLTLTLWLSAEELLLYDPGDLFNATYSKKNKIRRN